MTTCRPPGRGTTEPPHASPLAWGEAAEIIAGQAGQLAGLASTGAGLAASLRAEGHVAAAALVDTAVAALRGAEKSTLAAAGVLSAAAGRFVP